LWDDGKLNDPTDVTNAFNNFFITITEKLNIQQIEKGGALSISWKLSQHKNNPNHLT
jgi:hypothetical protein